jgi:hypothetical protein
MSYRLRKTGVILSQDHRYWPKWAKYCERYEDFESDLAMSPVPSLISAAKRRTAFQQSGLHQKCWLYYVHRVLWKCVPSMACLRLLKKFFSAMTITRVHWQQGQNGDEGRQQEIFWRLEIIHGIQGSPRVAGGLSSEMAVPRALCGPYHSTHTSSPGWNEEEHAKKDEITKESKEFRSLPMSRHTNKKEIRAD